VQASAYIAAHGVTPLQLTSVVVKNRGNGVRNEFAQLRQPVTDQEVADSPLLSWPIRRLDCAPRSSGAAAVLVGAQGVGQTGRRPVRAAGFGAFAGGRMIGSRMVPGAASYLDGADLAAAATRAYAVAGITAPAREIGCAELYAAFGIIELLSIEALGLCPRGEAARRIADGEFHATAPLPVNPSGGASCGNPLASTGLIRVIEATLQLWGQAGDRQVELRRPTAVVTAIAGAFQSHEVGVLAA
jgi:acetyl-CoA C-acetyltransferase